MMKSQELLLGVLVEKLRDCDNGLIISDIHDININELCKEIFNEIGKKLFVAIAGSSEKPQSNESIEFAHSIEAAVKWRSQPDKAGSRLVFTYGEMSKQHSLAEYDKITTRNLAEFLLEARKKSAINSQTQGFWEAIKKTISDYRYDMLLSYVNSISVSDEIASIPTNMWQLGLLCDNAILGKMSEAERLARLAKNHDMRIEICQLNSESRTRLNKTLQNFARTNERIQLDTAYKLIMSYTKYGRIAELKELDYEIVERLLSASKPVRPQKGKSLPVDPIFQPGGVVKGPLKGRELERLINESIVSDTDDDRKALSDITGRLKATMEDDQVDGEDEKTISTIGGMFEGRDVQLSSGSKELCSLLGRTCTSTIWGGVIQTKGHTIKDILSETDNDFLPFCPESKSSHVFQFGNRSLFECIVEFDERLTMCEDKFKPVLEELIVARSGLSEKVELIAHHPNIAFGVCKDLRNSLKKYLVAWRQLMKQYCEKEGKMREISRDATNSIARSLVCLDVLYLSPDFGEWKAVLLPLHPLYLWRYYEIFEGLFQSSGGVTELSKEDKDCLAKSLSELPNLVNFIIVDKALTNSHDIPLQHSGSFEMLPTFENKTNRYVGSDGIEQIRELLQRLVAFAPYTRYELRLAIIDVPDLVESIKTIKGFLQDGGCDKLVLDAYYTRDQNATGELTHLEYEAKDSDIGELIQNGRLSLHVFSEDLKKVEMLLSSRPVHLAYFFDQATYTIQHGANSKYMYISPLVITYDYQYDEITQQGRIYPTSDSEDDLVGNYYKMMRFADLVQSNMLPQPTLNSNSDLSPVNNTITNKSALWLAVADRITTNYNPAEAIPIGEKHLGRRHMSIWAHVDSRIISQYQTILKQYNLDPKVERLQAILRDFGHIASEGLISMPKVGDTTHLDSRRKGLLGTIFTAAWFRHMHPSALVASLDSQEARQWLYDKRAESNERADLIGLWFDDEKQVLNIDVLEVKTREGSIDEEHATEQVKRMIAMLGNIFNQFGAEPDLFTVSRREVLKYQIITECFRNIYDHQWKKNWSKRLKSAFSEHEEKGFSIRITGKIIHVKLNSVTVEKPITLDDDSNIVKITLNAVDVQRYIFGDATAVHGDEQVTDFDETKEGAEDDILMNSMDLFPASEEYDTLVESSLVSPNETTPPTSNADADVSRLEIIELARDFRKACKAYTIKLRECDEKMAIVGSGVIRFYVTLERGQGLDALRNKLDDIGREMRRSNLIVQTIVNSDQIILDVPRLKKDPVLYSDVEGVLPIVTSPEQLFFPIGKTPEGNDIIANLGDLPHILVGGSTGSGKTVFLFTLLASLIKAHPTKEELGLVLSSAGVEDFVHFEGLPHLINGKVTDSAKETIEIIQTVVNVEFERRARVLSAARVSNIIEYNKKVSTTERLRPIVIVIDEFADIADQFSKKTERENFYAVVRRIVQIGRKRGIHMVLCTQRPSANLVPTDIKAQLNARIALRVNDAASSRMILEISGAQNLQKHGDLIYRNDGKEMRAQGYYISIEELDNVLDAVRAKK